MIRSIADLQSMKEAYLDKMGQYQYQCLVCFGTGCVSSKCEAIRDTLVEELEKLGLTDKVAVVETGCIGTCAVGPILYVLPDETYYTEMTPDKVRDIVRTLPGDAPLRRGFLDLFIDVPSIEELRRRLEKRGEDAPEVIETRLRNAEGERARKGEFSAIVVNDDLATAYAELRAAVLAKTAGRAVPSGA